MAQDARLTAELAGADTHRLPRRPARPATDPRAQDAMAGQRALFEARRASLNSQIEVLQRPHRPAERRSSPRTSGQLRAAAPRSSTLIRREEEITAQLVPAGPCRACRSCWRCSAAPPQLEGTSRRPRRPDRPRRATRSPRPSAQIRQVIDQRMQEVSTELRDVRARLAEAEERLRAARGRAHPPRDRGAGGRHHPEPARLHRRRAWSAPATR